MEGAWATNERGQVEACIGFRQRDLRLVTWRGDSDAIEHGREVSRHRQPRFMLQWAAAKYGC